MTQAPPRVLFEISHPKHIHQFAAMERANDGAYVSRFLVKDKDINIELADAVGLSYQRYGRHGHSLGQKVRNAWQTIRDIREAAEAFGAELVVSRSSPYAAILGRLGAFRTMPMPDGEIIPLTNHLVAPLSHVVVTPSHFGRAYRRHVRVPGIYEETYLHPDSFRPAPDAAEAAGLARGEPYAVVRFSSFSANHDIGQGGFGEEDKRRLVDRLQQAYRVLITSEGPLPPSLEPFRFTASPALMHSVLHGASLYVGDSGSMAAEAALLGTPAIRQCSYVGPNDFANFKMLEARGMLHNLPLGESVLPLVDRAIEEAWKPEWQRKRADYFQGKRPLADLLVELVQRAARGGSLRELRAAAGDG